MLVARKTKVLFPVVAHYENQCFEFTTLGVLYIVHGRCYQLNSTKTKKFWISFNFKILVYSSIKKCLA